MTDKNELIIQPDDFGANALNAIQQKGVFHPDIITDKKQFQPVYNDYQFVRKFRIAIEKKSKELIAEEKKVFEISKKIYTDEEKRILAIIKPIETKLLDTRTAWETHQEEIAKKKADDLAAEQEAEFERQQKIKNDFHIAEIWDTAHGMNIDFDWKKAEDAAKDYALKWYEAHEENDKFDARKLAEKLVESTPEAKEELKGLGVTVLSQSEVDGILKPVFKDDPDFDLEHTDQQNQIDKVVDDPHDSERLADGNTQCPHCKKYFYLEY